MSKCLVTTLQEAITDSTLLKLGELLIHISANNNTVVTLTLKTNDTTTLSAKSPGYFTDSTGTSNLGNTKNISSGSSTIYLIGSREYDIVIENKYVITELEAFNIVYELHLGDLFGMPVGFLYLRGEQTYGDLSDFKNMPNIRRIGVISDTGKGKITGDVSSLTGLSLSNFTFGSNHIITGSLAAFSDMSSLNTLQLGNCSQVDGDIAALSNLTNLTTLKLDNTAATGDTSSLASLTNLTTFTYTNTAITGTWPLV